MSLHLFVEIQTFIAIYIFIVKTKTKNLSLLQKSQFDRRMNQL